MKSSTGICSSSWIDLPLLWIIQKVSLNNRVLTFIHFLDDRTKLVAVTMNRWLHLLELTLAQRVLVSLRIWIVVLLHISLVLTRYLHSVHVFDDHLLILGHARFLLFLIWVANLLNILHRGCLFALDVKGWLTYWLTTTVKLKIGLLRGRLSKFRFRLSSHSNRMLMMLIQLHLILAGIALICSSLHVCLLTLPCISWVVWCHWSFLLLSS